MDHKLHLLETFMARGGDGTVHKVIGYERLARDPSTGDVTERWEPTGMCEYRLADGRPVTAHPDGSYSIAGSTQRLLPIVEERATG